MNFLRSGSSPGDLAERTSRMFMGVKLECANCHDHPLDHWKQDDYHGLAAIFAKLTRGREVMPRPRGEVTHPVTGDAATPRIPGTRYLRDDAESERELFAKWLTSHDNPYFAASTVNRLWRQLMGRGLVEPVDDIRATNPATHPQLLDELADDLVRHGHRVKRTIGLICRSAAYQRDSATVAGNEMDEMFYSHALVKSFEPEVIADAIADATGVPIQGDAGEIERTIALTDNRQEVPSLDVLERCDRSTECSISAVPPASLARALHFIHGELVNRRVEATEGWLHQTLAAGKSDQQILEEIFLRTLTRPSLADDPQWARSLAMFGDTDDAARRDFFQDLMWGVLSSQAFLTNP